MSSRKATKEGKKTSGGKKSECKDSDGSPAGASSGSQETKKTLFPQLSFKSDSSKPVIGYVHKLSPLKRNNKDTLHYQTLSLQTGTDMFEDALCYSKAKRPLLMTSVTSRTPVKINRFTKTEDGTKLIINDMTSVTVADQAEYSFQYTEPVEVITDVSTIIEEKDPYNMVNIRGKVVQLTPVEKVGKQQFKLRNGAFVDSTGVIKLQIWQENIAEIEEGKAYTVTLARVAIWKGEKSVGTTKSSVITTYTGDLDTKDVSSEEIVQLLGSNNKTVIEVPNFRSIESVSTYKECNNEKCSKRIIQESSNPIIHCDQCGNTARASDLTLNICAKIVVRNPQQQKDITLTLFGDVLGGLVENVYLLDKSVVAEKLLMIGPVSITFNCSTNVVSQVTLL
jgi:hypothetical protein